MRVQDDTRDLPGTGWHGGNPARHGSESVSHEQIKIECYLVLAPRPPSTLYKIKFLAESTEYPPR